MNTYPQPYMPMPYREDLHPQQPQDERFIPFLAGAALAAPLFFIGGAATTGGPYGRCPGPGCYVTYPVHPAPAPYPYPVPYPYPYPMQQQQQPFQSPVTSAALGAGIGAGIGTGLGTGVLPSAAIGAGIGAGLTAAQTGPYYQ